MVTVQPLHQAYHMEISRCNSMVANIFTEKLLGYILTIGNMDFILLIWFRKNPFHDLNPISD
jgi:hypothetical protein